MTLRVAAAALAASALFATPALADGQRGDHHDRYSRARFDEHGARDAVQACKRAVLRQADRAGFRDVDFDGRRVRQVGPAGFIVVLGAEFEGRRREIEADVTCEIRRGELVFIDGVPRPAHPRSDRYGW